MKDSYWQDLANKHLVGRTIVKTEWLKPTEAKRIMGWDQQPLELFLDNGTILTPSRDDEGNDAGALFTNIKNKEMIGEVNFPVFNERIK